MAGDSDTRTKEQRERDWWDAWWAEDLSWDGLATKEWAGWVVDTADGSVHETDSERVKAAPKGRFRKATLQDYWRDQEGDLIASPDGSIRFTRVHLPLVWRDGRPTGKGEWGNEALDAILAPKLIAGAETKVVWNGDPYGADQRAQLQGTVLLRACTHPQGAANLVHLQCDMAAFTRAAIFNEKGFGPGARFSGATFGDEVWFSSATFASDVWFDSANFSSNARFSSAIFSGDARFDGAVFADRAVFSHLTFSSHAMFDSAVFTGDASFDSANFSRNARFGGATFSSDAAFQSATFSENAEFAGTVFSSNADFSIVTFSGNADFKNANCSAGAWFGGAIFSGVSMFLGATFSQKVDFAAAAFSNHADFRSVTFSGDVQFDSATFHTDAWFSATGDGDDRRPVTFIKLASFDSAVFKGPARFGEARFKGRMMFDKALFHAIADFSKVGTPNHERDWCEAFVGALFERAIDLRGVNPIAVSMVSGATFDRDVLLDRTNEGEEAKAHKDALELACGSSDRDDALKALEGGALKLKRAMNAANDVSREQRFYRLELRARRKQSGTRPSERIVSGLYAVASSYGASLGRPVVALAGVVAAFSLVFWAWEGGALSGGPTKWPGQGARVDASLVDAMRYSLSRTFPFGPWAVDDDRLTSDKECGFASRLQAADVALSAVTVSPGVAPAMIKCRPRGGWNEDGLATHRLLVGGVATLESLLSLPLYFLLGLAIRRKFQIS